MEFKKKIALTFAVMGAGIYVSNAQTGIGTNNPDNSAQLDITSNKRGVLLPRLQLVRTTEAGPVKGPAASLLIYNTATINDVTPGFYYWDGTKWLRIARSDESTFANLTPEEKASLKGDPGEQGPKGDAGKDGTSVTIKGSKDSEASLPVTGNVVGDGYIIAGDLWVWDGTRFNNVGPIQGPKGDTGAQGIQGLTGATGAAGAQGPIGLTGAKGDKGDAGAQGIQGLTGATGAAGAQGPIGLTGAKGDKGDAGAQGIQGLTGETGAAGAKGDKGDAGAQGPIGLTGAKGDKGDAGAQGIQGLTGATGAAGAKGDKGDAGVQGIQGLTGATGPQGPIGLTGAKGDKGDTGSFDSGSLYNVTSANSALTITGAGKVLAAPLALDIKGGNANEVLTSNGAGSASWKPMAAGGTWFDVNTKAAATANTQSIYQMSTNLGIGTATPNAQLQLGNTVSNRKIVLYEDANNDNQVYALGVTSGLLRFQGPSFNFASAIDATSSKDLMRLNNTGLGINTISPTNKLHVVAGANPLRLEGLQAGALTDKLLTTDANGVVRNLPMGTSGQTLITDASGNIAWGSAAAANGVMGIKVINSSYTVAAADYTIIASKLSGDITITLPDTAASKGRVLMISQTDVANDAGNEVTVKFNVPVVYSDSFSKNELAAPFYSATGGSLKIALQSDGTNWHVISSL